MSHRRRHYCVMCGRVGPWSKRWRWYGSIRNFDDGAGVFKLCSPWCQQLWQQAVHLIVEEPPSQRWNTLTSGPYVRLENFLQMEESEWQPSPQSAATAAGPTPRAC